VEAEGAWNLRRWQRRTLPVEQKFNSNFGFLSNFPK
jgi:hypothetical protein